MSIDKGSYPVMDFSRFVSFRVFTAPHVESSYYWPALLELPSEHFLIRNAHHYRFGRELRLPDAPLIL